MNKYNINVIGEAHRQGEELELNPGSFSVGPLHPSKFESEQLYSNQILSILSTSESKYIFKKKKKKSCTKFFLR